MNNIIYIGMDVHSTSYSLCSRFSQDPDVLFMETQIKPETKYILKYVQNAVKHVKDCYGMDARVICAYEAGCLGYTLARDLIKEGIDCRIMAPSSMPARQKKQIKNDTVDARKICQYLMFNTVSYVHLPSENDESVNDYINMRNDVQLMVKAVKQQILSLCMRYHKTFDKSRWSLEHRKWLKTITFHTPKTREALDEYLLLLQQLEEKIERFDRNIAETAHSPEYEERTKLLTAFPGIRELTALTILVQTNDFERFSKARCYASYLGLVPGEVSSGTHQRRTGITKSGNRTIRKLLIQSMASYIRWKAGKKSAALKKRQEGLKPEYIAYVDKAVKRISSRYWKLSQRMNCNAAKTAAARELACFIWGAMTGHTEVGKIIA